MRRLLIPIALVAFALAIAACTGATAAPSGVASLESAAPDSSATPEPSVDPEEAMLAFTECMRENGVDMPDPGPGGGVFQVGGKDGIDPEDFEAAQEACREHLEGVIGEEPPELTAEQKDAMLAHAQCMREHGIDIPDPDFSGAGGGVIRRSEGSGGGAFEMDDPAFQEAIDACREHLGDAFPGNDGDGPRVEVQVGPGSKP